MPERSAPGKNVIVYRSQAFGQLYGFQRGIVPETILVQILCAVDNLDSSDARDILLPGEFVYFKLISAYPWCFVDHKCSVREECPVYVPGRAACFCSGGVHNTGLRERIGDAVDEADEDRGHLCTRCTGGSVEQQLAALHGMDCPEAEYFITHMLPCYTQNLDELTRGRF